MFQGTLSAFTFNPDNGLMYGLYGGVIAIIAAMSIYYTIVAIRRAKALNMDMGKIRKVISTSVTFSILPAIGIGVGLVALIGSIGVALPAIRLSVIGSLQYETMMSDGAAKALEGSLQAFLASDIFPKDYVTIATVMTIPIVTGPLLVLLGYKRFQPKVAMLSSKGVKTTRGGVNIGELLFQVVFIGMILGYLADAVTIFVSNAQYVDAYFNFIALVVAALCMYVFELLINKAKWKWLDSFSTAFSMLIAMAVVAVISYFAYDKGWTLRPEETAEAAAAVVAAIGL